jgi:hypothetical protein
MTRCELKQLNMIGHVLIFHHIRVAAIDAGKNYVDFIPWIRFVPFAPYKRAAAEYYHLAETTYKYLMDEAKRNLVGSYCFLRYDSLLDAHQELGRPANSVAARVLANQHEQEADYREQYWVSYV